MSKMKTHIIALLISLVMSAASALPEGNEARAQAFATCSGRWSAVMEHEWLMGRDGEAARHHRAGFVDLLDAVSESAAIDGPEILHMRITAKHAHARLLQLADLGDDPDTARRARIMASNRIASCGSLILG